MRTQGPSTSLGMTELRWMQRQNRNTRSLDFFASLSRSGQALDFARDDRVEWMRAKRNYKTVISSGAARPLAEVLRSRETLWFHTHTTKRKSLDSLGMTGLGVVVSENTRSLDFARDDRVGVGVCEKKLQPCHLERSGARIRDAESRDLAVTAPTGKSNARSLDCARISLRSNHAALGMTR